MRTRKLEQCDLKIDSQENAERSKTLTELILKIRVIILVVAG